MCGHCLCVCLVQWEGNVANGYPIAMAIPVHLKGFIGCMRDISFNCFR